MGSSCSKRWRGSSGPRPPAVKHDPKAHHKGKETDLVDAVHHAQIQSSFFVLFEQVEWIYIVKELLEKHCFMNFSLNL